MPKTVRQIETILRAHGWTHVRTAGSHRQWVHPDNGHVVTVPGLPGKQLPVGTLSSIRRTTGIKELR
ncbi:MAG: type II toxin-antitoxin system HicA family toxin [Conexibacter sp.]